MAYPTFFTWVGYKRTGQDESIAELGGEVLRLTAGATLNIGDAVYISADDTVNKAIGSAANKPLCIGIVIGGRLTGGRPAMEDYSTTAILAGVAAANVNQDVFVLVRGIAYVVSDAAITVGNQITLGGTTAGRVAASANYTVAAGGTAVTSSAANGAIINGEGTPGSIGKMLEGASGAGQVKKAYICPI